MMHTAAEYKLNQASAARLDTLIDRLVSLTKRTSLQPLVSEIEKAYRQVPEPLDHGDIIAIILRTAAETIGVQTDDLASRRFSRNGDDYMHMARFLAMYWLYHQLHLSLPAIARVFRLKHHTSVMHGRDRIERMLHENAPVATKIAAAEPSIVQAVADWKATQRDSVGNAA